MNPDRSFWEAIVKVPTAKKFKATGRSSHRYCCAVYDSIFISYSRRWLSTSINIIVAGAARSPYQNNKTRKLTDCSCRASTVTLAYTKAFTSIKTMPIMRQKSALSSTYGALSSFLASESFCSSLPYAMQTTAAAPTKRLVISTTVILSLKTMHPSAAAKNGPAL